MNDTKRILITGAAGGIGSDLIKRLAGRYNFVLLDTKKPQSLYDYPYLEADITNLESVRSACRDIDTVIHLAAEPSIDAAWESLLPHNIIGTYNLFQAAHEAGCRRMIFASSAFAVLGYPQDVKIMPDMPVRPPNLYGVSKVFGESVGRFYADQKGLSCICLRIGFVKQNDDPDIAPGAPILDKVITFRDLAILMVASIESPDSLRFGIFHALSDNRHKRLDISDAQSRLGYAPRDDAYDLAEANAGKSG